MRIKETLLLCFLALLFTIPNSLQAQPLNIKTYNKTNILTEEAQHKLQNLPLITLPEKYKNTEDVLPMWIDNSLQDCWRPVFAQVDYECGQASGIGLAYTYEINRSRELNGAEPENQYPPHYAWNWENDGDGYHGVSYFHSYEMLKTCGSPNVVDYGGMYIGDQTQRRRHWMSGYDKYYNGMKNRINEAYQIDVSTPEGIQTLKYWIYNHLDGSDVGGVATFYANAPGGMPTLPGETPEGGKYVVTSWGNPTHGMTILAYHDSICWDYNGDGQYTNDIDINGDGEIDVRDWEIGGFRFANTYSGGPNFGNDGFCYMTYKSCADPSTNGGIWNNAVHVVYAKEQTEPILTAKIKIKHKNRKHIRVRMGCSTNPNATEPEYIVQYPIFNFQGGDYYPQGGTTEEDKMIEFGLDITPFLNMIPSGSEAKYFLVLYDDDINYAYEGEIINFSILDYTNETVQEITYPQANIPMVHGENILGIVHTVDYQSTSITSEVMPDAVVFSPYEYQVEADGGTPPYYFDFDKNFVETTSMTSLPTVNDGELTPGGAYSTFNLGFDFPFYENTFSTIRVHSDGYISFENEFTWPFESYDPLIFPKNKIIAPFMGDLSLSGAAYGIWYEETPNSVIFKWKAKFEGSSPSDLQFYAELFHNGDIAFYYGDNTYSTQNWLSGISSGDNVFYQYSDINNDISIPEDHKSYFERKTNPDFFQITPSGLINGVATELLEDVELRLRVRDASNLYNTKTLTLSTDGSIYFHIEDYSAHNMAGSSDLKYGDTVLVSVNIKNWGAAPSNAIQMEISTEDEFINLLDNSEELGVFGGEETKTFQDAFSFVISENIPNGYPFIIQAELTDIQSNLWQGEMNFTAAAPSLAINGVSIVGGSIDPGETADIFINIINTGGVNLTDISILASTNSPYLTLNENSGTIGSLVPGEANGIMINATASEETPLGSLIPISFLLSTGVYENTISSHIIIGVHYEGFETGDFSYLPWTSSGNADWIIDDNITYEGFYAARSGAIVDNGISCTELNASFLSEGPIKFARKVSSEANYDYLRFYKDGTLQGEWDGEQDWSIVEYSVPSGIHTLKWCYEKDYSVSSGSDAAWIDSLSLPPVGELVPSMSFYPEVLQDSLLPNIYKYDTVIFENAGTGPILYDMQVLNENGDPIYWVSLNHLNGVLNPGELDTVILIYNTAGFIPGDYEAKIVVTDHTDQIHEVPILLNVDITNQLNEIQNLSLSIYPNPFEDKITIQYKISKPSAIALSIFDSQGKLISKKDISRQSKGKHKYDWNGKDVQGNSIPEGVYYLSIYSDNEVIVQKLLKVN